MLTFGIINLYNKIK